MKPFILLFGFAVCPIIFWAQKANLIVGSGAYFCEGSNIYVHLPGDIRCDGLINMSASSTWSFEGTSQQRITCLNGTGCTNIYNSNGYPVRLGSVEQHNSTGIAVEINTKVKGIHYFNSGSTEIKEGNYWLTQTLVTPFSLNDNVSKFFVTTGHGLLKQSNVATGTLYPLGSSATTNDYTPITIAYSGTPDDFGVRVFDNTYYKYDTTNGDAASSILNYRFVKKTWIIKKTNRVKDDLFTVTPKWNLINEDANFTPRRPTDISITRNNNGSWWQEINQGPATPPTGAGPFTYSGIVTYNQPWEYFPVSVSALNVVLANNDINLTGALVNDRALLNWSVLSERNISYYEILRSTDAQNFKTVTKLKAQQNSQDHTYNYTDTLSAQSSAILYYKIRQISYDNKEEYSNIVAIKRNTPAIQIAVFPNPVQSDLSILFLNASGKYIIKLFNETGTTVKQLETTVSPGTSIIIPFSHFGKGIYFLKVINKNTSTTEVFKVSHN